MKLKNLTFFLLMPFVLFAQTKKDTIRVYYLGGQSNMEGFGYVNELPDSLKKKNKNVFYKKLYIFYHNFSKNKIKVLYDCRYSAISCNTQLKLYFLRFVFYIF